MAWGIQALLFKYLIDIGINIYVILFYIFSLGAIFCVSEILLKKQRLSIKTNQWVILVLISLFSALANIFILIGYEVSPNIGYVGAVGAGSISLVTLFSAYFFKDELTPKKLLGTLGVMIGIIVIFL